ncbi:MAG: TIGR02206 family membrane protein [Clostridiales bacterium]|nr:TIGR02206 family membrane protein [Clostridiales bacterium]
MGYFAKDAPMVGIFSAQHVVYLCFCAISIFLFIKNREYVRIRKEATERVFLGILLFQQIFLLYGWYFIVMDFDLAISLPFHMCRLTAVLAVIHLIFKIRAAQDASIFFSLFALASLFYPKDVYNFAHINGLSYMIYHLQVVIMSIYSVMILGWRPEFRAFKNAALIFTVYFPAAIITNALTGGNYFYQNSRPFLSDLSSLAFGAFSYFGTLAGFALICFCWRAVSGRISAAAQHGQI